ncbi:MAG: M23 family metallopeptidase [Candidatus Obscuribacterales bacterium]|nr:M23 family metallopeptidase [Candidatus Obscuribacterales bacterium]
MASGIEAVAFRFVFATAVIFFSNFNSLGKAEILISDKAPCQGETIELTLDSPEYTFNGKTYKAFPNGSTTQAESEKSPESKYVGLLAVPADLDPGKYLLKAGSDEKSLSVRAGQFVLQHINLPKSKDNFEMSPGEKEAIEGAKATVSEQRLWTGKFQAPSKARVSASFGIKRVVNGKLLKDYFHAGIDYAGGLGSPITACSDGKVIVVGHNFKLHGNCVCLDHGQGVVSIYIHMQKIAVKEGQMVHKGEQIGTIGASGRATGPHLHFSLYVNQSAANPNDWYQKAF